MITVYTATAGKYPIKRDDIKCFTGDGMFTMPVMEAKRYKVLPHLFFPDADVTLWLDGNIWPLFEPEVMVENLLRSPDADMAMFCHPYRNTVWQEFGALKEQQRFQIPYLQQQLRAQEQAYRAEGLPDDTPLYECNVLVRRNNERVNRLMEAWWAQICRWQWRDQVSLPYVLWKHGAGVKLDNNVPGVNVRDHYLFRYVSQH